MKPSRFRPKLSAWWPGSAAGRACSETLPRHRGLCPVVVLGHVAQRLSHQCRKWWQIGSTPLPAGPAALRATSSLGQWLREWPGSLLSSFSLFSSSSP